MEILAIIGSICSIISLIVSLCVFNNIIIIKKKFYKYITTNIKTEKNKKTKFRDVAAESFVMGNQTHNNK